jgi:hypothetical protein
MTRTSNQKLITILPLILPLYTHPASAGGHQQCKDEYEDQVQWCAQTFNEARDREELQQCVEQARDDFESCRFGRGAVAE